MRFFGILLFALNIIQPLLAQEAPDSLYRKGISPSINSNYLEARPMISPKGDKLFFCRRFHPRNMQGTRDGQDVWVSHKRNGKWLDPVNLGEPINNKRENALVTLSPDQQEMVLFNTYYWLIKGSENPISVSKKSGNSWGEPEEITINNFSNDNDYVDFYRSYSPDVLLMAIEKPETEGNRGSQDLYVSFPEGENTWSTPKNLGGAINTSKAEFAPFLGKHGKRLFFVSLGLAGGEGGSDIFYAERKDDSWQNWTKPVSVGRPINSGKEETYFSISNDYSTIYFESYKANSEERNLFKAPLPARFRPSEEESKPTTTSREDSLIASNNPANGQESQPVENTMEEDTIEEDTVTPENTDDPRVTENNSQDPEKNIPDKDTAQNQAVTSINAESGKIRSESESASPPPNQEENTESNPDLVSASTGSTSSLTNQINQTLRHVSIKKEGRVRRMEILKNIYFNFNDSTIRAEYKPHLKKIAGLLAENPGIKLELSGFADDVGSHTNNIKISRHRANKVAAFIREQGNISDDRIIIRAMGEKYPLASNDDEREGRELNRRVEIVLIQPLQ